MTRAYINLSGGNQLAFAPFYRNKRKDQAAIKRLFQFLHRYCPDPRPVHFDDLARIEKAMLFLQMEVTAAVAAERMEHRIQKLLEAQAEEIMDCLERFVEEEAARKGVDLDELEE